MASEEKQYKKDKSGYDFKPYVTGAGGRHDCLYCSYLSKKSNSKEVTSLPNNKRRKFKREALKVIEQDLRENEKDERKREIEIQKLFYHYDLY